MPITQNGCLRIMSNPAYPNPIPVKSLADRLGEVTADSSHAFLADDVSVLDVTAVDAMRIHGPRQITDVYLLALAVVTARGS